MSLALSCLQIYTITESVYYGKIIIIIFLLWTLQDDTLLCRWRLLNVQFVSVLAFNLKSGIVLLSWINYLHMMKKLCKYYIYIYIYIYIWEREMWLKHWGHCMNNNTMNAILLKTWQISSALYSRILIASNLSHTKSYKKPIIYIYISLLWIIATLIKCLVCVFLSENYIYFNII